MMYLDYYLLGIILLPGLIFAIIAEVMVSDSFKKYSLVASQLGQTASEVARTFLDNAGLHHIQIVKVSGHLTDHYHHKKQILALSEEVYDSTSIAALGVACHEVGHAIQYQKNYTPIKIRNILIPICNFGSKLMWVILFMGMMFYYLYITPLYLYIGIGVFTLFVLFHLVTLPCELDASKRATLLLQHSGYLNTQEMLGAKKVLRAAALTYVAALVVSMLDLLRLVLVLLARNKRRD